MTRRGLIPSCCRYRAAPDHPGVRHDLRQCTCIMSHAPLVGERDERGAPRCCVLGTELDHRKAPFSPLCAAEADPVPDEKGFASYPSPI
jgi:hypothetical protein